MNKFISLVHPKDGSEVLRDDTGSFTTTTGISVPDVDGVPVFVEPDERYADSFGFQWARFPTTQVDGATGGTPTTKRFFALTGWTAEELAGQRILEVGCGAGRYTEVMLKCGAVVHSVDLSAAIFVARENNKLSPNVVFAQASVYDIPFPANAFDYVFCIGVLQHTPDPDRSFDNLTRYVKPGGKIAVDVYARDGKIRPWKSKYLWRWLTVRMPEDRLLRFVRWYVPKWLKVDTFVASLAISARNCLGVGGRLAKAVTGVEMVLRSIIPCFNFTFMDVPKDEVVERSILDTFDALSATYDDPRSARQVREWFRRHPEFTNVEVIDDAGIVVGRARKSLDGAARQG